MCGVYESGVHGSAFTAITGIVAINDIMLSIRMNYAELSKTRAINASNALNIIGRNINDMIHYD